jgi:hypothetical protein
MKESFEIFENILFFEMESSKLINQLIILQVCAEAAASVHGV